MDKPILEVTRLKKYFPVAGGQVHAVDDVSFAINAGETLGLVGESGCGKSTTGRLIIRLIEPTSGEIVFDGQKINTLSKGDMGGLRRKMQIIFQDPYSSLDPRRSIGDTIGKPLEIYRVGSAADRNARVNQLMEMVGLSAGMANKYPHELDGGRRQRVGIARALALSPRFIVCDEPVSALDVSIQAQILNLLLELQKELGLTYLFVSHDLSVVKHLSSRVAVMYLGKIVEMGPSRALFKKVLHPYSQALLSAVPVPKIKRDRPRILLKGGVPSPVTPPSGCRFHTRCLHATERCAAEEPLLREVEAGYTVACHLV